MFLGSAVSDYAALYLLMERAGRLTPYSRTALVRATVLPMRFGGIPPDYPSHVACTIEVSECSKNSEDFNESNPKGRKGVLTLLVPNTDYKEHMLKTVSLNVLMHEYIMLIGQRSCKETARKAGCTCTHCKHMFLVTVYNQSISAELPETERIFELFARDRRNESKLKMLRSVVKRNTLMTNELVRSMYTKLHTKPDAASLFNTLHIMWWGHEHRGYEYPNWGLARYVIPDEIMSRLYSPPLIGRLLFLVLSCPEFLLDAPFLFEFLFASHKSNVFDPMLLDILWPYNLNGSMENAMFAINLRNGLPDDDKQKCCEFRDRMRHSFGASIYLPEYIPNIDSVDQIIERLRHRRDLNQSLTSFAKPMKLLDDESAQRIDNFQSTTYFSCMSQFTPEGKNWVTSSMHIQTMTRFSRLVAKHRWNLISAPHIPSLIPEIMDHLNEFLPKSIIITPNQALAEYINTIIHPNKAYSIGNIVPHLKAIHDSKSVFVEDIIVLWAHMLGIEWWIWLLEKNPIFERPEDIPLNIHLLSDEISTTTRPSGNHRAQRSFYGTHNVFSLLLDLRSINKVTYTKLDRNPIDTLTIDALKTYMSKPHTPTVSLPLKIAQLWIHYTQNRKDANIRQYWDLIEHFIRSSNPKAPCDLILSVGYEPNNDPTDIVISTKEAVSNHYYASGMRTWDDPRSHENMQTTTICRCYTRAFGTSCADSAPTYSKRYKDFSSVYVTPSTLVQSAAAFKNINSSNGCICSCDIVVHNERPHTVLNTTTVLRNLGIQKNLMNSIQYTSNDRAFAPHAKKMLTPYNYTGCPVRSGYIMVLPGTKGIDFIRACMHFENSLCVIFGASPGVVTPLYTLFPNPGSYSDLTGSWLKDFLRADRLGNESFKSNVFHDAVPLSTSYESSESSTQKRTREETDSNDQPPKRARTDPDALSASESDEEDASLLCDIASDGDSEVTNVHTHERPIRQPSPDVSSDDEDEINDEFTDSLDIDYTESDPNFIV